MNHSPPQVLPSCETGATLKAKWLDVVVLKQPLEKEVGSVAAVLVGDKGGIVLNLGILIGTDSRMEDRRDAGGEAATTSSKWL